MEGSLPYILIELKVNSSQPCYTWTVLPNPNVTVMPDLLLSTCPYIIRPQSQLSTLFLHPTFQSMLPLQKMFLSRAHFYFDHFLNFFS